jgi:hypothetical protein
MNSISLLKVFWYASFPVPNQGERKIQILINPTITQTTTFSEVPTIMMHFKVQLEYHPRTEFSVLIRKDASK